MGGVQTPKGVKVAMIKWMASKSGFWSPRQKPLITAANMRTLNKARRLEKRLERVTAKAGVVVTRADVKHFEHHH